MKRYKVYRHGALEDDSFVILDFGTVPPEENSAAEQEAYDMACSPAVSQGDSIEGLCDEYPQLAGFDPWVWKRSSWEPQGMNRDALVTYRRHAARTELVEYLRRFIDMNARYLGPEEMREILEQVLSDTALPAGGSPDR
jgi:hypothetical protein